MLEVTMIPDLDLGIYKDSYVIYDSQYKLELTLGGGEKDPWLSFKKKKHLFWLSGLELG